MAKELMFFSIGETLGDGLVKLPAIAAAREAFPDYRIVWAVAQGTVYQGPLRRLAAGVIDEIIADGREGLSVRDLFRAAPFGGRRFDVVIDTQLQLLPALVARRAARRVFVSAVGGFALSQRRPGRAPWPEALVDQLAALVGLAAGRDVAPGRVPMVDTQAARAAEALLPAGPVYVGLAPGAGVRSKCWPLENYLALAARVRERGAAPVFFIGPDEAEWLPRVRAEAPFALLPEWDRADPHQDVKGPLLAAALAGRLAAAIANDSGIGHALAAGGAPLVSLQVDARKAAKFRPASPRLRVIVASAHGEGMQAIPIDAVEAALRDLLEGAP